jgi:superfamily II DNA or RNA helicase
MLREEQIDNRRRKAVTEGLEVQNVGRNRVFSDYQVTNPTTHKQYQVVIRGFDLGDNLCDCPDFLVNTLGMCKHIEAVLNTLRDEPPQLRRRKAALTRPEIYLQYAGQWRVGVRLPPRHSDQLHALAETFFDGQGLWKAEDRYKNLIEAVADVPEQVTILSDAMHFMEGESERKEMAERERDWLNQLEREEPSPELCDLLKVPLYPYQMRGAIFLACRGRCILGDDMGLGKTVQTLAAVELLARERGVERVLVVAPASVKYQWETEIQKYTGRPVQVVEGNAAERRARYKQPTFYRLINYETVVRDLKELNAWQPDLIVLDEAQRIKNWQSKTSKAVKHLKSRYAVVLTGTPLENKLEELFSIVAFVDERRLGPAFQFLADHRIEDADKKLVGYRNLDLLREKLAPILLRRTRAEVLSQLPARTDTTVTIEMAEAQRPLYAEHQATLGRILQKKYLTEVDRRRILCCIANLRMLCDSTFLLDHQTNVSPKLEEVEELLRELLGAEPHKVVVFSQWEVMLRKAAEVVEKLGVGHTILHGNIPGKDRRKLLERFRDDPECRVFLSTDAGGTGLNLQAADTVINLEVPWNPAVLDQRIARVHRMGQHRPVQVFNLVTRDSIEERVLRTLEQKRSLLTEIFTGGNDEMAFGALGHQAFLETMRALVGEVTPRLGDSPAAAPTTEDSRLKLVQAGVQLLEALAEVMADSTRKNNSATLSAETLQRGTAALRSILKSLGSPESIEIATDEHR